MSLSVDTHSGFTVANTALDLSNTSYYTTVFIANRSTTGSPVDLWIRLDGTISTVGGDNCYLVQPGTGRSFHNLSAPSEKALDFLGVTTASVISSSICPFYIEFN